MQKRCFYTLSLAEVQSALAENGFEKFRARQVFGAVYAQKIFEPRKFPAIGESLKDFLEGAFEFSEGKLVGQKDDSDETKKYLFALNDGNFVESVMLKTPAEGGKIRQSLCLSTQVGCASGCKFCASTMRGFVRNLTAGEILAQALPFVRRERAGGKIRGAFEFENIVVMGMGEPLANFDSLMGALSALNDADKFAFGARRITVSTCGLADKIRELAKMKFPFRLAISLHAATDDVREKIMPINRRFNIAQIADAAAEFARECGRMITLEYILIDSLNDTPAQASKLADIAKKLHAHINLIPYNPVEGLPWKRSSAPRRKAFAEILKRAGAPFTLRREKGAGIDAACGQLALKRAACAPETRGGI